MVRIKLGIDTADAPRLHTSQSDAALYTSVAAASSSAAPAASVSHASSSSSKLTGASLSLLAPAALSSSASLQNSQSDGALGGSGGARGGRRRGRPIVVVPAGASEGFRRSAARYKPGGLLKRSDGSLYWFEPAKYTVTYDGEVGKHKATYRGEWTIHCGANHTHTRGCDATATGYGTRWVTPTKGGPPEACVAEHISDDDMSDDEQPAEKQQKAPANDASDASDPSIDLAQESPPGAAHAANAVAASAVAQRAGMQRSASDSHPARVAPEAALGQLPGTHFGIVRVDARGRRAVVNEEQASRFELTAAQRGPTPSKASLAWHTQDYTYRGSMKDGTTIRHGLGQSTLDSGSVFVGEYREDKCEGQGTWRTWDEDGSLSTYEGLWKGDVQQGPGKLSWRDPSLGIVRASGPFEDGQMHGEACQWVLQDGHVYFSGTMERGTFKHGRLVPLGGHGEMYVGSFDGLEFDGTGCYAFGDGSYYFGDFREHEREGLGVLFVLQPAEPSDAPATQMLRSSLAPGLPDMAVIISVWAKDSPSLCWVRLEPLPSSSANGASASAPAAAAAASSSSRVLNATEALVWQAVQRLLRQAVPAVASLQQERSGATTNSSTSQPSQLHTDSICATLTSSPSAFRLINVRNVVYAQRARGVCAYRCTGELGNAEMGYVCVTCAEAATVGNSAAMMSDTAAASAESWEICQACAETTKCHAGHTLMPLAPSRRFICDCGKRHGQPSQAAAAAAELQRAEEEEEDDEDEDEDEMKEDERKGEQGSRTEALHWCDGMLKQTSGPQEWPAATWPARIAKQERERQNEMQT